MINDKMLISLQNSLENLIKDVDKILPEILQNIPADRMQEVNEEVKKMQKAHNDLTEKINKIK